jgi:Winged helix-turn helix
VSPQGRFRGAAPAYLVLSSRFTLEAGRPRPRCIPIQIETEPRCSWVGRRRVEAGPRPEDGVCTLRGPEIRDIVEREFGVAYSLPAVYFLLHRLGYEPLDPRSRHIKADPAAQEEFKKK